MPEESRLARILWLFPLIVLFAAGLFVAALYSGVSFGVTPAPTAAISTPTRTLRPTVAPTASPLATGTATPTVVRTPTPTVVPGGLALDVTPAAPAVGWVASNEPDLNHLGDYNLHSGVFSDTIYYAALRFDISDISPGTRLQAASLELTGLNRDLLGATGSWTLELLSDPPDLKWASVSYRQIRDMPAISVGVPVTPESLGVGRTNVFDFDPAQLSALEKQVTRGFVTFRIDGPRGHDNNLFTWDSGYQQGRVGLKPVLRISTGALAPTSTPTYVVVTSTPTPRNEATVEALAATATYVATVEGTATPLPSNWVTPVLVTPTPEATSAFAAATRSAIMTAQAIVNGTATPTPPNWQVVLFVTATPTAVNNATAAARSALATADAVVTGTPTPLPANVFVVTPTPTPLFVYETVVPSPSPSATPEALPSVLLGKIAFLSDRSGTVAAYIMDSDGNNVARLTSMWPYLFALARDKEADGGKARLDVQGSRVVGTKIVLLDEHDNGTIVYQDSAISYDPSFSPDGQLIAFVSTVTGRDEIYTVKRNSSDLRQLTTSVWEWNKHPSWSPDGRRLVWWSNRVTGHKQIWIMSTDGSEQSNLSNDAFDNWDPVWIR